MAGLIPVRKSAGQRRHLLELQEDIPVTDAIGGRVQSWATYASIWGSIESQPLSIQEDRASVQFIVTVKYLASIMAKYLAGTQQRLIGGGQQLKVLAVTNPDQRNKELILYCAPENW